MQKSQRGLCWMLFLLGSLILTLTLAFSYWMFVPREVHLWSLISRNYSEPEAKFSILPGMVPEGLKLKHGPPFVYQILH
ncbi:GL24501 [Drosophila persimilis]|uniref:GL24501 n=1 Tax=Drosophila persimilis TaxID=7234 RepID=B4G458_DROPE|nr:uncharacterized protein LOC6588116 [Drosophila persimilis]EDW25096.1 GL24501 [Drosophila persimilis]